MDVALASVLCVAIVGLSAPATAAIVKLVPRRRGHNSGFCTSHTTVMAEVETLKAVSEERQTTILHRLERIEEKLDKLR